MVRVGDDEYLAGDVSGLVPFLVKSRHELGSRG